MTNAKAIVSEVDEHTHIDDSYVGGIKAAKYDFLVDACLELLANDKRRVEQEDLAHETIKKMPQHKELYGMVENINF